MEKKLTKRLEKFVSNAQNHIFAGGLRSKVSALNESVTDGLEKAVKNVTSGYRKVDKYVCGKGRTKRFLMESMGTFEKEHNFIVSMIESGDVKDNWDTYVKCKGRISAILRANRRLNSLTDNTKVKSYVNEYITRRRFEKKYQLAT